MTQGVEMLPVTATLWLERAEKHNPILPTAGSPMLAAVAEEMEEYADRKVAEFARAHTHPAATGSVREAEKIARRYASTLSLAKGHDDAEGQKDRWYDGGLHAARAIADEIAAAPTPDAAASEAGEVAFLRQFYDDWCKGVPDSQLRRNADEYDWCKGVPDSQLKRNADAYDAASEAGEVTWRIAGQDSRFGPFVVIDGVPHDQVVLCFWRNQIQPIHLRLPGQAYVKDLLRLMDEHQCEEVAIIPVRHKERVSLKRAALTTQGGAEA